jgi:hypothetical protein
MTPAFNVTAQKIRMGSPERQIAVMQNYTEENSTMATEDPGHHTGKHNC